MVIRYITDDLEIFLMIMLQNRLKLNSLSDLFLTIVCKIVRQQKSIQKSFYLFYD